MRPSENRLLALPIPWKREAEGWTPTAKEASGVMKQSSGQPDAWVAGPQVSAKTKGICPPLSFPPSSAATRRHCDTPCQPAGRRVSA